MLVVSVKQVDTGIFPFLRRMCRCSSGLSIYNEAVMKIEKKQHTIRDCEVIYRPGLDAVQNERFMQESAALFYETTANSLHSYQDRL